MTRQKLTQFIQSMILDRVEGFFFILDQAFSEKDLNHIFDLKAIVNVFSYGKKRMLILYAIIAFSHVRKTASFQTRIFLSTVTLQFLYHFRCPGCPLLFNKVLFTQIFK